MKIKKHLFFTALVVTLVCFSGGVRAVVGISQTVFEALDAAQVLIEAEDLTAAEEQLKNLLAGKKKLNIHEKAQINSLLASIYYQQNNYQKAYEGFLAVKAAEDIPYGLRDYASKALIQIAFLLERYDTVVTLAEEMLKSSESPDSSVYVLKGQALFKLEHYPEAVKAVQTAITLERDLGRQPREQWLLLLNAVYYNLSDYDNMISVLKELNALYPNQRYVLNLAAVYGQMDKTKEQLLLMEPLYDGGLLTGEAYLLNLANLFMLHKVPVKGAKVIDVALQQGTIKRNQRNLELLAQAWQLAAEDRKTIEPLKEAAKLSEKGSIYVRLASIYMNLYDWKNSEDALEKALKKGQLTDTSKARILLGMSRFYQKNYSGARKAFEKAGESEKTKALAQQWLTYLSQEESVEGADQNFLMK